MKAIEDLKRIWRVIIRWTAGCGDVGFGKTEVAMRAAFKAVQGGKQVALLSPITILADQHYKSLLERMKGFQCPHRYAFALPHETGTGGCARKNCAKVTWILWSVRIDCFRKM